MPTTPLSDAEPTADVLARAEGWMRGGRVEEAGALCTALLQRLVPPRDAVAMGACEHMLAHSHHRAGSIKDSVLCGYRAIELLEGTEAINRLLQVYVLQASALARLGALAEAIELLDRAIHLLPRVEYTPRESCVFWTNASSVYQALGQLPRALDAAQQASDFVGRFDDAVLVATCLGNLLSMRVALICRDRPQAVDELAPALAELETHIDGLFAAGLPHLVGDCVEPAFDGYMALGEQAKARVLLERAVQTMRQGLAGPAQGHVELRLAQLDRIEGHYADAAAHLAQALAFLNEGQTQEQLALVHLESSLLSEAQADWRAALASFKKHAAIREAALKSQADTRTQAMAMRLDLERSRLEAELLRRRNEELQASMSQLSDQASVLKRQAIEDPLTGLANRRQLEAGVGQLSQLFPDTPQMLLIADIDHFKRINDTWSHATGDDVLKAFADLLRAQSRPNDVLARIGGEEFVIALGGAVSMTRALLVAERLRAAIEGHAWGGLQPGLCVTMCIGVAARQPGESLNDALGRADAALYECKRSGRNQVRCAT
jgi:diguanylate cyclase (GGDEF)-like protein